MNVLSQVPRQAIQGTDAIHTVTLMRHELPVLIRQTDGVTHNNDEMMPKRTPNKLDPSRRLQLFGRVQTRRIQEERRAVIIFSKGAKVHWGTRTPCGAAAGDSDTGFFNFHYWQLLLTTLPARVVINLHSFLLSPFLH